MSRAVVRLDTRKLDRIASGALDEALQGVAARYAHKVEEAAKQNLREAPKFGGQPGEMGAIDTGALLNSVHVTTSWGESGYGAAASGAKTLRPEARVAEEAKPDKPKGGGAAARVDAPMEYALYVEKGTARMPPRPYLLPALEAVRDEFTAAVRKAVEGLAK
ncbi:MAG: hypothetical protein GX605_11765 [Chloroflexi bacterium]|nr:hypothetical protein [Chloroflexota bacterium]